MRRLRTRTVSHLAVVFACPTVVQQGGLLGGHGTSLLRSEGVVVMVMMMVEVVVEVMVMVVILIIMLVMLMMGVSGGSD